MMKLISRSRTGRRGFSLLEMMVTLGIIAVVMSVAIPLFSRSQRKSELRSSAQRLVGDLRQAQTLARSGKANVAAWGAGVRAASGGIRFISQTQYAIFVDQDDQWNGSEAIMEVVDITGAGRPFEFISPPAEVRFENNGTLPNPADIDITVRDSGTNERRVIRVTYGGKATLHL